MNELSVEKAMPEHASPLADLFERNHAPCYCRYWHFDGETNDWLDRCAHHAGENRAEMTASLETAEAQGFVALDGERVVGWLKMTPSPAVEKIYGARRAKGLPLAGDLDGVYTVGCFLIDEPLRRKGVARALLQEAIDWARHNRVAAIDAFPRRAEGVSDAELMTGPYALYEELGFRIVDEEAAYPAMRLEI